MPLTYSGRSVTRTEGVPSIPDIALSLSRQPRFGGHCRRWWSVLDHTLFMYELAKHEPIPVRLAVLLHDAHEAITADIPTDVKTPDVKEAQRALDDRIFRHYYQSFSGAAGEYDEYRVRLLDRRALHAEGMVVGPPHWPDYAKEDDRELLEKMLWPGRSNTTTWGYDMSNGSEIFYSSGTPEPSGTTVAVWLGNPEDIAKGVDSPLVKEYIRLVLQHL